MRSESYTGKIFIAVSGSPFSEGRFRQIITVDERLLRRGQVHSSTHTPHDKVARAFITVSTRFDVWGGRLLRQLTQGPWAAHGPVHDARSHIEITVYPER